VSLLEAQAAMKRPSFDGRSVNEVIGRMEGLLFLNNEGKDLSQEDQHVLDCANANAFIKLYNTAMLRLRSVHDHKHQKA
jgi:hypothetical protein